MNRVDKSRIVDAHEPHWPAVWVWVGFLVVFFAIEAWIGWTLIHGPTWLVVPLVLIAAHLMHAHTLAFHEAGHGTLCDVAWINETIGLFIGTLSLQGVSAFRAVHQTHHNYLGTERDEELWPFVIPTVPRWVRRLTAFYELSLGITYTPMLCVRTFLRDESPVKKPADRRRILYEYAGMAVFWAAALSMIAYYHVWKSLLVMYIVPGILAGNMHSLRKYTEHMGLTGSTILSSTRSIVATGPIGRIIAVSMFNITYHGVHHRYAKIPQARLPELTTLLAPSAEGELPPYSSYWQAIREMVSSLGDPRVGSQWAASRNTQPDSDQAVIAETVATA